MFPRQWEEFRDGLPPNDRDGNLAAAYSAAADESRSCSARARSEPVVRLGGHAHRHGPGLPTESSVRQPRFRLCFARLVTHYWSNAAFIEDGHLFRNAHRLEGIPILLVHGQLDMSSPPTPHGS